MITIRPGPFPLPGTTSCLGLCVFCYCAVWTGTLVSILSLETAMIDHFGELSQEHFRRVMTGAVGAGVCAIVFSMAVFMIVRARKELRQLQHEEKGG